MTASKSFDSKPYIHNQYKLPLTAVPLYVNEGFLKEICSKAHSFCYPLTGLNCRKSKITILPNAYPNALIIICNFQRILQAL